MRLVVYAVNLFPREALLQQVTCAVFRLVFHVGFHQPLIQVFLPGTLGYFRLQCFPVGRALGKVLARLHRIFTGQERRCCHRICHTTNGVGRPPHATLPGRNGIQRRVHLPGRVDLLSLIHI